MVRHTTSVMQQLQRLTTRPNRACHGITTIRVGIGAQPTYVNVRHTGTDVATRFATRLRGRSRKCNPRYVAVQCLIYECALLRVRYAAAPHVVMQSLWCGRALKYACASCRTYSGRHPCHICRCCEHCIMVSDAVQRVCMSTICQHC